MNKSKHINVKCNFCNSNIVKYKSVAKLSTLHFCNKQCKNRYQIGRTFWTEKTKKKYGEAHKGKNNPNYNNKWTDEQKLKQSLLVKNRMQDCNVRYAVGSANRGKKFDKCRIDKMHKNRLKESYSRPHTEKSKLLIGVKSKEKFTKEYKKKQRKLREEKGYWIPLDKKTDYEIYSKESNWIERMFDRATDEEIILLENNGVFNCRTNTFGCVRDHKYSRKSGFSNGVFPELLRHPCNCRIILHKENVSTSRNKNKIDDIISLDILFDLVYSYNGVWKEQDVCLVLINNYKKGKRWIRT